MRLSFNEIESEIYRVITKYGISEERARLCARIHTESNYDGIYSHGTNRIPRFIEYIKKGWIDIKADPVLEKEFGSIQIFNGNLGIGVTNALYCTDRAMELAEKFGIGMVGLKNTTHWMRGGTYGLYAAEKGFVSIMWTNTDSCMAPWGGKECKLGNNPLVIAAPPTHKHPAIKLDMAVSQFSYGKAETLRLKNRKLPYDGGLDENGNFTNDPETILRLRSFLPTGLWKGSGLAFMFDILGAILTDGLSAEDMDKSPYSDCGGCSQVFILIDPKRITNTERIDEIIDNACAYIKTSKLTKDSMGIFAPGEHSELFHKDHDKNGIFVDDTIWEKIKNL